MRKAYKKYLVIGLLCTVVFASLVVIKNSQAKAEDVFLIEPADTLQTTTRDQRVNQRKAEQQARINEQSLKNLSDRCEKIQKIISTLKTKDAKVLTARHDFYTDKANKLNYIVENLKKQNISSAALETANQPFTVAVNKYLADAQNYKAAVDDLAAMNCSEDTAGFRATILSSQKLRAQLATDAENVKATFTQIRAALQQAKKMLPKAGS